MNKISEMLKEGGVYSLTRLLSVIGFIVFVFGSAYLIYKGMTTFATMTGGGSAATQIANKLINSKYNTASGEVGKQIGGK